MTRVFDPCPNASVSCTAVIDGGVMRMDAWTSACSLTLLAQSRPVEIPTRSSGSHSKDFHQVKKQAASTACLEINVGMGCSITDILL
jgi:hypothetical protein